MVTGTKRETSGFSGDQSREFAQAGERIWGSQVVHHPGESSPGKAPSGEAGIVSTDACPDSLRIRRWRVPWDWQAERSDCFRGSADRTALAGRAFGRLWQADNRETEDLANRSGSGG
jgi:hypothetical protein